MHRKETMMFSWCGIIARVINDKHAITCRRVACPLRIPCCKVLRKYRYVSIMCRLCIGYPIRRYRGKYEKVRWGYGIRCRSRMYVVYGASCTVCPGGKKNGRALYTYSAVGRNSCRAPSFSWNVILLSPNTSVMSAIASICTSISR